jgi:Flp pilus assembly protein TadD
MKRRNGRKSLVVCILAGCMSMALIGCAASDKSMINTGDYESVFQKHSRNARGKASPPFSDEMSSPKAVPKLSSDAHEWSADVYFREGKLEMAFVEYNKSLEFDPDNERVYYKRGLVFLAGGLKEEAMADFEKVLTLDPDHALAHMGLGQVFFQKKKYPKAEDQFRKAIALDSKLWKSHNFLGIIHDYRGQHMRAAMQYLAAISLKPESGLLYNNLGISYYLSGDYEKAIQAFRDALERESSQSKIYNNLGLALSKAGRMNEAFEAFRNGGDEARAHNNVGCVYAWHGDSRKAIRSFKKAIETKPAFYTEADDNLKKCRNGDERPYHPNGESSFDVSIPRVN